jgi:hypothetical protein
LVLHLQFHEQDKVVGEVIEDGVVAWWRFATSLLAQDLRWAILLLSW